MKLKSFFANTIEEAIGMARHELGPDAMLVNSKRAGAEAKHLGLYEVVVCADTVETPPPNAEPALHGIRELSATSSLTVDKLSQDLCELKLRMEKIALSLGRNAHATSGASYDAELSRIFTTLTDAELDTDLAYEIIGRLSQPSSAAAVRAEIFKLIRANSELGSPGEASRIVALVGPPGAGKTSALIKLALRYGVAARKSVHILSADTYRIAAADELRSYAAILGVGCQTLETAVALEQALDQNRNKDLILIDSPGLCRAEMDAADPLVELIARRPCIDTHLVLPASMRASDMRRVAEQYALFRPDKLIFTRLDETQTFGPILNLSVRMGIPISFFSHGQRIPEDLEAASVEGVLDLICGRSDVEQTRFGVAVA